MASLLKRSNGIYYSITYLNGKRIWKSTGCRSRSEARLFLKSSEKEPEKDLTSLTLGQFKTSLFSYLETNVAPSTMSLYKSAIKSFERIIGNFPLSRYDPMMIEEFKNQRSKEVSPVKVNIDFRDLRASFNLAINWGLIKENPFHKCKQLRTPQQRPAYLSKEEFRLLLKTIDKGWYKEIVRFALSTMMRLGEILNMTWDSVDLEKRLIYIENRNNFQTKTNKSRVIPMDEITYHLLLHRTDKSGYIFRPGSATPFTVGYISRRFKTYIRKAGIREEIHFHSLRHTGATWLVQNNIPLFSVQKLLGHSNIEVTQIYSHLDVEHLRKPLDTFRKILELSDDMINA